MDIHEFLGANYGDLFDPPECNFDLQDSINNDWLDNIFASSSSSLSPSSSSSISSSSCTSAPMTGIDDIILPGSTSPDSVHYEHSYSMGRSCDSSPSVDSWHNSTDKGSDPFEFLRDLCPPIFDLGCEMVEDTASTRIKEEDDNLDVDPQWMVSSSSSSSSPSSCGEASEPVPAAVSPPVGRQTKKSIVLLTDADGQTMTFTSEETNNSSSSSSNCHNNNNNDNNNNNNNEELILVDWNYEDQDEKDPIDLSMYRGKLIPFSNGKKDGPTVIHQAANGLTVTSFSSPWQNSEDHNAPRSYTLTEALFSNPVPTDGQLLLTDEEKNTLVAEGYPVPSKLPLGKAEEKYLKKIRRKIKNKISAQESRRKKKEYMDHLELKMHKYCQENTELMKKVEHLECNNRQLLVQLRNIQKILKVTAPSGGTSLMVLVLFFAAFIGSWSPISWSIGYGRLATVSMMGSGADQASVAVGGAVGGGGAAAVGVPPMPCAPFIGPDLQHPMVDVYSTLSRRSRLLMSTKDEEDAYNDSSISSSSLLFGPTIPASYIQTLAYWFSSVTGGKMTEENGDGKSKNEVEEEAGVDDCGFTVKHILPLTQHYIFKEAPKPLTSNETFRRPLSNSQPVLPFPVADKTQQSMQAER